MAAIGFLEGKNMDTVLRSLMAASVKASTMKGYRTECTRLLRWTIMMNGLSRDEAGRFGPITDDVRTQATRSIEGAERDFVTLGKTCTRDYFFAFLIAHASVHPLQFKRVRSALKLGQLMAGAEVWATSEVCKRAEKAAQRLGQASLAPRTRRGTLDSTMLATLISEASAVKEVMAQAMEIQANAALRIGELLALSIEDVTAEGIFIFDEKRAKVLSTETMYTQRSFKRLHLWSGGARALRILHRRIKDMGEGPRTRRLFPREAFQKKEYNGFLRATASKHSWEQHLKFDGSHVLRHAGVGKAVTDFAARNVAVTEMASILLMSVHMLSFYALSNQDRTAKVYVPQVLRDQISKVAPVEDSEDESDSDSESESDSGSDIDIEEFARTTRRAAATTRTRGRRPTGRRRREPSRSPSAKVAPQARRARHEAKGARMYSM